MAKNRATIVTRESQSERYAVIEFRGNEVLPEHFPIAYSDEESLRELIAAPSIIGTSLSSREAAAALISSNSSSVVDSKNSGDKLAFMREEDHCGSRSPRQRLRQRVGLTEIGRMACATLQHAVAAGVLMFYSRSVLGPQFGHC